MNVAKKQQDRVILYVVKWDGGRGW